MPMVRPKPRQLSHAPMGELNENRLGLGSRCDRSHSAQCSWLEKRQVCRAVGGSESSTTCTLTRPCPTRSAASSDSRTRPRSAPRARKRSCTTDSVTSGAEGTPLPLPRFLAAPPRVLPDFLATADVTAPEAAAVVVTPVAALADGASPKNRVYPCFSNRPRT